MFRQNKSTIKNIGCGFQEKYLIIRHNFGSKSVKYLGEEAIKKFKYMTHYAIGGSKQLVSTKSKKSIQMRSDEQMGRKELGSLINIVSKSKPQLPFLFVAGGLNKLTHFNLLPSDNNTDLADLKDIEKIETYMKGKDEQNAKQRKYYHENKDKILKYKKEYYQKNRQKLLKRLKEYNMNNKDKISENSRRYRLNNKDKISKYYKEYKLNNKEKLAKLTKEYALKNKDIIRQKKKEHYYKNKDEIVEYKKRYYLRNKEKIKNYQKNKRLNQKLKKDLEDKQKSDKDNFIKADDKANENSG